MSEETKPTEEPIPMEGPKPTPIEILLSSPDIQKAIAEIPSTLRRSTEIKTKWTAAPTIIAILILVGGIIGVVAYLTAIGKLSSDAVAFLFGTIVGASFTFLQKFLPGR